MRRGFTLLEVVVALAILGLALMAIFDLNAGAVSMHAYTKKVTVATMLARSKMTDLEQDLYDKGFPADDEERSGDFSSEGWSGYQWKAEILAPKTQDVSSDQLLSTLLNLPGGDESGAGGLLSMFTKSGANGTGSTSGASGALGLPPGASPLGAGGAGPLAGLAQSQMTQFLQQIQQAIRQVHLTVSWKDGKREDSVDLVTHVVSVGPGSDRNGVVTGGTATNMPQVNPGDPLVNPRTGAPVMNPVPGPQGATDPNDPSAGPLIPLSVWKSGHPQ